MKKGFSIVGTIVIIAIVGLSIFALLVNIGYIKMKKEATNENMQIDNNQALATNKEETNNDNSKVDIYNDVDIYNNVDIYSDNEKKENTDKLSDTFNEKGNIKEEKSKISTVNLVYSLEDKITNDTMWCGTFNLVWNMLKNDLAKKDIIFENMTETVKNLNKGTFSENELDEDSYYSTFGFATPNLKKSIERAIKEKFNETSDILDKFNFTQNSSDYFLYSMLKKEFKFRYEFDNLENSKFGDYDNIKFFGVDDKTDPRVKNQVDVLYYKDKEHFGVRLITKSNDEVYLIKGQNNDNFKDIFTLVQKEEESYRGDFKLGKEDTFKVPLLKVDCLQEVTEVENKQFSFANGESYYISKALQSVKFELDSKGGKIKSEAAMGIRYTARIPDADFEIRNFDFDNEFVIFLKEDDATYPYFAAKINDITRFQ